MNRHAATLSVAAATLALGFVGGASMSDWLHPARAAEEQAAPMHLIPNPVWVIIAKDNPGGFDKFPKSVWEAHIKHDLEEETNGTRIMGGAVSDADGKREYGMFLVRATDKNDAMRIAKADPAVMAGERTVTVHQFEVHQGEWNLKIHISDGKVWIK